MSTEPGSAKYLWYSSSTSHSFGPKSLLAGEASDGWSGAAPSLEWCSASVRSTPARGDSEDTADIALFQRLINCSTAPLPGYRRSWARNPGPQGHARAERRSLSCGESQFTYGPLGTIRVGLIQSWVW